MHKKQKIDPTLPTIGKEGVTDECNAVATVEEVRERMFDAFSQFNFAECCNIINYRGGITLERIDTTPYPDTSEDSINPNDFFNSHVVTAVELQQYVKHMCDIAVRRWQDDVKCPDNNEESEFYSNDIDVTISPDGSICSITYMPVQSANSIF